MGQGLQAARRGRRVNLHTVRVFDEFGVRLVSRGRTRGQGPERVRAACTGRNPQSGESLDIAASTSAAFKPAAPLKRAVAGN
jgi:hypothetical protein